MLPDGLRRAIARTVARAVPDNSRMVLERRDREHNLARFRREAKPVYVGADRVLCRILGRYKMFVDSTDKSLAPHLMLDGYWEIWVTELISQLVRPGMICVDAGANFGYFTLLMADLVGPEGRVYAFEPNPPIRAVLSDSVVANGFGRRVSVQSCLLEDRNDAYMQLCVPEGFAGGAAMLPPIPGQDLATLFMTKRMDSFPELLDADLIKIDAEGAEYSIWKGMTGILERNRPLGIFIEFVACRYENPRIFIDEIISNGFALFEIDSQNGLVSIDKEYIFSQSNEKEFMLFISRS